MSLNPGHDIRREADYPGMSLPWVTLPSCLCSTWGWEFFSGVRPHLQSSIAVSVIHKSLCPAFTLYP